MNKRTAKELAELTKTFYREVSPERAAILAYDCLMQFSQGMLNETIDAWKRELTERQNGGVSVETCRNGVWVPAIPIT
jgi:hypothetical protein